MTRTDIRWNTAMIKRYDMAGPRYTSYPTAPQFDDNYTAAQVDSAVARSNAANNPLSLYFHIPFCDTVCYYCGCNKIVTANKQRAEPYLSALYTEMKIRAASIDCQRPVHQLHWGGGTPTFISDNQKRDLMQHTRQHFNLLDDDSGEYSIEIHPGAMSVDTINVLRELGFNRLSMGVQDFDPKVQKAVNRFNSYTEVKELTDRAQQQGFHSLSMDIIYGLPYQSLASVRATLDQVIDLNPDRLSLFNYAHMPHLFKTQKQMDSRTLPEPQEKLAILEASISQLQAAGYVYIGMDHFAKPEDPLAIAQRNNQLQRNFQGYATHGNCDLFAFGVSAISSINNIFVQNHKDINEYTDALSQHQIPILKGLTLSEDDLLRQSVINQLICHFKLDFKTFEQANQIQFDQYFASALTELKPMIVDGLINLNQQGLSVSNDGRLLIRRICMAFDAYLQSPQPQKYSRII